MRHDLKRLLCLSACAVTMSCEHAAVAPAPVVSKVPMAESDETSVDCPLREKIGQMLVVAIPRGAGFSKADGASAEFEAFKIEIASVHAGGVFVVPYNVRQDPTHCANADDIKAMIASLKSAVPGLLVATDREGGQVQTLRACNGFPPSPSARELAEQTDASAIYTTAKSVAGELREFGFNWTLAPVVDVVSPLTSSIIALQDRSYGREPARVARLAAEAMRGISDAGLISTAKHFPGHGSALGDSHAVPARLNRGLATLAKFDLAPYTKTKADTVMVGHILLPKIYGEKAEPASLNENVISDSGFTPYGKTERTTLRARLEKIAAFYKSRGIAEVIVACNAASCALAGDTESFDGVRFTGIISSGVRAVEASTLGSIGVIGGELTIRSQTYQTRLAGVAKRFTFAPAQALSALVEAGELSGPQTEAAVADVLARLGPVEGILLACTHYPALAPIFKRLAPDLALLDPADFVQLHQASQAGTGVLSFLTSGSIETTRASSRAAWDLDVSHIGALII